MKTSVSICFQLLHNLFKENMHGCYYPIRINSPGAGKKTCEKHEKCFFYFFYTAPTKNRQWPSWSCCWLFVLKSILVFCRQPPQCFLYETCDRLVEPALEDCPIGRENTIGATHGDGHGASHGNGCRKDDKVAMVVVKSAMMLNKHSFSEGIWENLKESEHLSLGVCVGNIPVKIRVCIFIQVWWRSWRRRRTASSPAPRTRCAAFTRLGHFYVLRCALCAVLCSFYKVWLVLL